MTPMVRYKTEQQITGMRDDDLDARFKVCRNGKAFYINVLPSHFTYSPTMTDKYLSYLEVLRSGEEVLGDIYDTDVYEWIIAPFEPLFDELALDPPGDLKAIWITLRDHLFPDFCLFDLDIVNGKTGRTQCPMVLINNCQTECFFRSYTSGLIHTANLGSRLNLYHLCGVVMDDDSFILRLLLTNINKRDCPLPTRIHTGKPDELPAAIRKKWVAQLDATITELHKAGVVWGDVKAENVLIGRQSKACITDFGSGYTDGWVGDELAGTVEGDLVGMAKLRNYILSSQ
ncbi:hypothetical protein EDB81DRAFT_864294 [Dactylonectria macrodidyma]|uniref:Protein kinase domain-containing protein n=1 Tax=Dactylonectria macrodidyma TaxID=307937 RepID=A0A9P9JNI9_9HYPO|nr:hypothetical protein EDB81DRAFT_864294 [Dactylonectria macrodidyma]